MIGIYLLHKRNRLFAPGERRTPAQVSANLIGQPTPPACYNLYFSICKSSDSGFKIEADPTGEVRPDADSELMALRMREQISLQHPDWNRSQVEDALAEAIYTKERRKQITSTYHWVHHLLKEFIQKQPPQIFNENEKRVLLRRLKKTELQLPPPATLYANEPGLLTRNDVFYEHLPDGTQRMRIGGAYLLGARSRFNQIFTIAHEFAHSIDPCELRIAGIAMPAYDRITACFLRNGLIATRKTRSECGNADQLSETFADWMATQVSVLALSNFATEFLGPQLRAPAANSVRDLCEPDNERDELDTEHHPPPLVRINAIFGRHPEIRKIMGCPVAMDPLDPEYCDFSPR